MSEKNTDQIVMQLLKKVDEKKQEIGNAERPSWNTNCTFMYVDNGNMAQAINIQVLRNIPDLVDIHAYLTTKYTAFKDSLAMMKLTEKEVPFKHLGFTYEQWVADVETRINQLRISARKAELASLETRVNALISPEQRRAIELEKLVNEIG